MAGSGKSTLMHRMVVRLTSKKKKVYTVNLDPAVKNLAYPVKLCEKKRWISSLECEIVR